MATKYIDDQVVASPPWLQGRTGAAWAGALGDVKDTISTAALEAVKARFPSVCPSDALAVLAADRQIPRGPGESDASYRTRLAAAWSAWTWAGTPYGMLMELYAIGVTTNPEVSDGQGRAFVLTNVPNGDPSHDLMLSGTPAPNADWFKFYVFLPYTAAGWAGWPVRTSAPPDGSPECQAVQAVIRKWKGAVNVCTHIMVFDFINPPATVNWTPPT